MNDRRKTYIAIGIIIGSFFMTVFLINRFISGRRIVSPVPEEHGIKIIFLTPTPTITPAVNPTSSAPKKSS